MPDGPPDPGDDEQNEEHSWENWREQTRLLPQYEGREIRIIFEGTLSGNEDAPRSEPATFGDFDPEPDDPNPEVWPLKGYDPGRGEYSLDECIRFTKTYPAPHVKWVTPAYLESKYGYNPTSVEINAFDLPPWRRGDALPGEYVEIEAGSGSSTMTLTEDRLKFCRRLAHLWRGGEVRGKHLLRDKLPKWEALFGDLDQTELVRLFVDPDSPDQELIDAFGDHEWFNVNPSVFLRGQWILHKEVKYAPTLKIRTLINRRDDIQDLRGDPKEGLSHRFLVGLTAVNYAYQGWDIRTYAPVSDYVVDVVAQKDGETVFVEVVTGHHNWELHRSTYNKLVDLNRAGRPVVHFDKRETAYQVFNHWHRNGLATLPLGTFDNEPRIDWGREKIQEAYAEGSTDWVVADWDTTTHLWRNTLGADSINISDDWLLSLTW